MQTEEPKKNGGGLETRPSVIAIIFTVCRVLCSGLRGQNWLGTRCNIHSYMHKLCAYCLKKIKAEHSPGNNPTIMVARSTCLSYVGSTPSNEKTMVLRLAMDLKTVVLLGLQGVKQEHHTMLQSSAYDVQ